MEDDDDDECPLWWQTEVTYEELQSRMAAARARTQAKLRNEYVRNELREQRWEEFEYNSAKRSWAIWKCYRTNNTTLKGVGHKFGLTPERVRQIVTKYDRKIRCVLDPNLNVAWDNVSDEVREATLGVEFTFRNELTFVGWNGDMRGWDQLEPTQRSPHYPAWMLESGQIDEKPRPIYTYYQIAKKEQTND